MAGAGPAAGRVAQRGGPAPALTPFPVPGRSSLWTASRCWGGWLVLVRGGGACRAVGAACNRGPTSSTSASTSGLSRPVLPRRLWRVVGWVGFLLDVIGGMESALWEGCYPALTLAPTCEANRALYGYDPSATLNDAATLNNTTRYDATDNDSTHDDLATPTTTTRPTLNVNAD